MRTTKKLLAIATVAALLLGAFGATASAAASTVAGSAFPDASDAGALEGDLQLLATLGVYQGYPDGTAGPANPITRAEFAAVLIRALGREGIAKSMASLTPSFADANSNWAWAWGYVNVASSLGIIQGYPDGTFGPSNNVTHAEALAMTIRAIAGHNKQVVGTWPVNYVVYAADNGFSGSVDVVANLPATRAEVAHFIRNMMGIDKLDATGAVVANSAILAGRKFTNETVTAVNAAGNSITLASAGAKTLADTVRLHGASSFQGLLNQPVNAVADASGKIVYIEVAKAANVASGTIKSGWTSATTNSDGKRVIQLTSGAEYIYDPAVLGATLNSTTGKAYTDLAAGDEVSLNLDANGQAVYAVAVRWNVNGPNGGGYVVTSVTKSTSTTDTSIALSDGGPTITIPSSASVTINGAAANRDDLKADDVVYVATTGATGTTAYMVKAFRNTVSGKVKSTATYYTSSGVDYRTITLTKSDGTDVTLRYDADFNFTSFPATDSQVTYGLNEKGYIRVAIGVAVATNNVKVTGFYTSGTSNFVIVDKLGTSATYGVTGGVYSSDIGKLGQLTVDNATGKVTLFTDDTPGATTYEVYAVDAANGTVTIGTGGAYYFINSADLAVYQADASWNVGSYIGLAGIKVGDLVRVDATSGTDFMLRKAD